MHSKKGVKYRADIDGLRAVAILMVVLFHIWPNLLPGGFIGVDIFFVISGFLITSIINFEITNNIFSFKSFYLRRIKRILPLFFFILLVTSIAGYFLLLPDDYKIFSKSAISASLYVSNIYFMNSSNYFSLGAAEYPLLHTWSLSVEEQYYLIWPLTLFIVYKKFSQKFIHFLIIIILLILSIIFAIYCSNVNQSFGYYSIFSRAFELMLGALLSIFIASNSGIFITTMCEQRKTIGNLLTITGFIMIFYSAFYIDQKTPFPGYMALFPTVGTVLIIYAGHLSSFPFMNRLISTKLFVRVGLISYSMYLWHWPIIAFWHYFNFGIKIPIIIGLFIIACVVLLSIFTYKYIEQPFKFTKYSSIIIFIFYQWIPICLVLIFASLVIYYDGLINRFSSKINSTNLYLSTKYCNRTINLDGCIFGDKLKTPPKVIFFGDSHSGNLTPFWDKIASSYGFSIKIINNTSCYPLLDTVNKLPSTDKKLDSPVLCANQIEYISKNFNKYDVFVMAGAFSSYIYGSAQPDSFKFLSEFENTLKFLSQHDKKVVIMGDIPIDRSGAIPLLIRHEIISSESQTLRRRINMKFDNNAEGMIRSLAAKYPNVYYFDTNSNIFSNIKTLPFYNGVLIYKDSGHLNQNGSELLAKYYLSQPKQTVLEAKLLEWNVIKR